jgi:hypothetical protein
LLVNRSSSARFAAKKIAVRYAWNGGQRTTKLRPTPFCALVWRPEQPPHASASPEPITAHLLRHRLLAQALLRRRHQIAEFVAFNQIASLDLFVRLGIDGQHPDAMTGLRVDLVEPDRVPFVLRIPQSYRATPANAAIAPIFLQRVSTRYSISFAKLRR